MDSYTEMTTTSYTSSFKPLCLQLWDLGLSVNYFLVSSSSSTGLIDILDRC